jgi:hypothetical protein
MFECPDDSISGHIADHAIPSHLNGSPGRANGGTHLRQQTQKRPIPRGVSSKRLTGLIWPAGCRLFAAARKQLPLEPVAQPIMPTV